jgi:dTDP-4-dehydrorhamnose 3,5-epimerase-like enzyme
MTDAEDMRGSLVAVNFAAELPFLPRRMFVVFHVPSREVRGEHAHRVCEQFLVCLAGQVAVVADDGTNRQEFLLDTPTVGLYLPPMVWGTQYAYSPDARLAVLASHEYDPADYIRDYDEFLSIVQGS